MVEFSEIQYHDTTMVMRNWKRKRGDYTVLASVEDISNWNYITKIEDLLLSAFGLAACRWKEYVRDFFLIKIF